MPIFTCPINSEHCSSKNAGLNSTYNARDAVAHPRGVHCQWHWRSFAGIAGAATLASLMQGRLRLLCIPNARDVFFSDLPLAAVHDIRAARHYRDFAVSELATAIGNCDLFLCFQRDYSPSVTELLRALKPEKSIGLVRGFDVEIPFHRAPHASDLAFAIPMELAADFRIEDFAAPPKLPDAALALAKKLRTVSSTRGCIASSPRRH